MENIAMSKKIEKKTYNGKKASHVYMRHRQASAWRQSYYALSVFGED
jgi:hypothetical protein